MGNDVSYLYEPEGSELHWDGLKQTSQKPPVQQASLSGGSPTYSHPADRQGMQNTSAVQAQPAAPRTRPPTYDELMAKAKEMLDMQTIQNHAQLASGPSVGQGRDDAGGKLPEWLTREMERPTDI